MFNGNGSDCSSIDESEPVSPAAVETQAIVLVRDASNGSSNTSDTTAVEHVPMKAVDLPVDPVPIAVDSTA